jgi:hypothetical protein
MKTNLDFQPPAAILGPGREAYGRVIPILRVHAFAPLRGCRGLQNIYFTSGSVCRTDVGPTTEYARIYPLPVRGSEYPAELIHESWLRIMLAPA